jgi:hypothetical protein
MNDKDRELDPSLSAPQEANTVKHINFLEAEDAEPADNDDRADGNDANESPTKKAWEELRKENSEKESSKE